MYNFRVVDFTVAVLCFFNYHDVKGGRIESYYCGIICRANIRWNSRAVKVMRSSWKLWKLTCTEQHGGRRRERVLVAYGSCNCEETNPSLLGQVPSGSHSAIFDDRTSAVSRRSGRRPPESWHFLPSRLPYRLLRLTTALRRCRCGCY